MSFLPRRRKSSSVPVGKPPTVPVGQGRVKTAEEAKREAIKAENAGEPLPAPPSANLDGDGAEQPRRMSQSRRISQSQFGKPLSELPIKKG